MILEKTKKDITIWNAGVCFIGALISFVIINYLGKYVALCNAMTSSRSSLYSSSSDSGCSTLVGYFVLFVIMLIVSATAIVAGIVHARKTIEGGNQKTVCGFLSTVSAIILHGFLFISFIITLVVMNDSHALVGLSTASIPSLAIGSMFAETWGLWIALIFSLVNIVLAVFGLVFVCTYKPKAAILDEQTVATPTGGASVIDQFAKPEKKDLPPMLNGDAGNAATPTAAANPSISGLRSMQPLSTPVAEQPTEVAPVQPQDGAETPTDQQPPVIA